MVHRNGSVNPKNIFFLQKQFYLPTGFPLIITFFNEKWRDSDEGVCIVDSDRPDPMKMLL